MSVAELEKMLRVPTLTRTSKLISQGYTRKKDSIKRKLAKLGPYVMPTAAAASFDTAAFLNGAVVGLVVTGLSLFFLEWRFEK
jgi:hypothetical protein